MTRTEAMKQYIAHYKAASMLFHKDMASRCPELCAWDVLQGLVDEQMDSIDIAFFSALHEAEMADSPSAYTDYQENLDREKARA